MSLVCKILEWQELEDRNSERLAFKVFWPIMTNVQKQEYYQRKHDFFICGDVDEIIGAFSPKSEDIEKIIETADKSGKL